MVHACKIDQILTLLIQQLMDWHRPRVKALLEAGVDILALETIPAQVLLNFGWISNFLWPRNLNKHNMIRNRNLIWSDQIVRGRLKKWRDHTGKLKSVHAVPIVPPSTLNKSLIFFQWKLMCKTVTLIITLHSNVISPIDMLFRIFWKFIQIIKLLY